MPLGGLASTASWTTVIAYNDSVRFAARVSPLNLKIEPIA